MKQYIGTKVVQAEPAFRVSAGDFKNVIHPKTYAIPEDRTGQTWEDGYKVVYPDGYVSWSPKEVFEEAYRPTDGMNFGLAIEAMKKGERVARKGWNGKDMYVFLAYEADFVTDADISAFDQLEVEVSDMLIMKTAQNTFQPGWLASQADMLADDWYIVE